MVKVKILLDLAADSLIDATANLMDMKDLELKVK